MLRGAVVCCCFHCILYLFWGVSDQLFCICMYVLEWLMSHRNQRWKCDRLYFCFFVCNKRPSLLHWNASWTFFQLFTAVPPFSYYMVSCKSCWLNFLKMMALRSDSFHCRQHEDCLWQLSACAGGQAMSSIRQTNRMALWPLRLWPRGSEALARHSARGSRVESESCTRVWS